MWSRSLDDIVILSMILPIVFIASLDVGEARLCYSPSRDFRGVCLNRHNCENICIEEGFESGLCKVFGGIKRRCLCYQLCTHGGKPPHDGDDDDDGGSTGGGGGEDGGDSDGGDDGGDNGGDSGGDDNEITTNLVEGVADQDGGESGEDEGDTGGDADGGDSGGDVDGGEGDDTGEGGGDDGGSTDKDGARM
ncbi:keratin, type I cytoskeletal 9-like [Impatiens glandulifera]|uniref:keratin, type I cytoskeletal 9-like n=1 Tax=Impatiens glandulifera TaxID=253017 RepID=UPI001FB08E9F|nr:keratin, type I cytoskeletal 9-like [Impatiens glandulifera]